MPVIVNRSSEPDKKPSKSQAASTPRAKAPSAGGQITPITAVIAVVATIAVVFAIWYFFLGGSGGGDGPPINPEAYKSDLTGPMKVEAGGAGNAPTAPGQTRPGDVP